MLQLALLKNGHSKWHLFTVWIYNGTSKSGKIEKTMSREPEHRCQLSDPVA